MSNSQAAPPLPTASRFSVFNVLVVALPLMVLVGGVMLYLYYSGKKVEPVDIAGQVKRYVVGVTKLDPAFNDADQDLVADRPEQTLDPEKLVFRTLDEDPAVWKDFCEYLEERIKKPVELRYEAAPLLRVAEKFKAGEIHLASFSTGMVPTLVNTGGFVPAFCMANDKGEYTYHGLIVVAEKSPIQSVAELKGHSIALTTLGSLSSCKAPIRVLDGAGLKLGVDYQILFTRGQRDSIEGLAANRFEAIAVASDYYQRTLDSKKLPATQFRTIHKSEEGYPSACFGYHHALNESLVVAIRQTFLEYPWGDEFRKEFEPADYTKFVPVSYKTDWAGVRKIDEDLGRFLGDK